MNAVNLLPVNSVLKNIITSITATDLPPQSRYSNDYSRQKLQTYESIINPLGILSARALGLKRPITSLEKLRSCPDQKLYILKDEKGNSATGEAIGFLKVGPKSLFLYDKNNKLKKATPMCILDFYILENKQRRGYGKKLFDFMLQHIDLNAVEMAIDCPTDKLLKFLKKHYGYDNIIKQVNNFVVCAKFFEVDSISNDRVKLSPPPKCKWHTEIASIIHGEI